MDDPVMLCESHIAFDKLVANAVIGRKELWKIFRAYSMNESIVPTNSS